MSILNDIVSNKREELRMQQQRVSTGALIKRLEESNDIPRGFMRTLSEQIGKKKPAVIAEIKKSSPTSGVLRQEFNVVELADNYMKAGATCLSVLTEKKFFQGDPAYIAMAREVVELPVLRKDFIIDKYQILESRVLGADAILLIAALLDEKKLKEFILLAHDLGMDVLVEVHDSIEFHRAMNLPIAAIGVNNRNLQDFSVSLETSIDLSHFLPKRFFLISESGIATKEDIEELQEHNIYAYLIGTCLLKQPDPGQALKELLN